jgi:4-hydroxybenzoyl-CoA thioesterase
MSKTIVYSVNVFGDCDPQACSSQLCQVDGCFVAELLHAVWRAAWREQSVTGIIGTPLLEINKFMRPPPMAKRCRCSQVDGATKVLHRHIVKRGDDVLCEGTEVRAFCKRLPENPDRIKAIPVPADIKALCV